MNKDPIQSRISLLMVFCLTFAGILVTRAAWVQVGRDSRIEKLSQRQFGTKVLVTPRRGTILDRNGEPLAINTETRSLAMNPQKVIHKRIAAGLLARALGLNASHILHKMSGHREFAWIKRHLSEAEFDRLRHTRIIGRDGDLIEGLWIVEESERVYPHNELAAHVIGDTNLDTQGTEGVELWQDKRLKGKIFSLSALKDALGRPAFIDSSAEKAAEEGRDGESITLTLDASLQFSVEEELRNAVIKADARGGSVIVMNALNGEILAMANEPSFNPNDRSAPQDRRRNRALTDGYEPGSTMKPVLLASALTNGMHLSDQIWGENGHFKIQGKTISEAEAHEKFEWLTLKKIIQVSSNVGAAKLALKLGADKYLATLKAFGFGNKTEIGFPGEISGRVPPRKSWLPITTANIGFGHGVLVTPIQMTRAYAAFLNGGWLVQPTILKDAHAAAPKRIFNEHVSLQVLEALESTTQTKEGGTGGGALLNGYRVGGKTGTAQKVDPLTGHYSRSKYVASFIGFPLSVDQKIVIFASIDEPHGAYYGGAIAAPLFREVLNIVANRFSLPTPAGTNMAGIHRMNKGKLPTSFQAAFNDEIHTAQAQAVVPAAPSPAPLAVVEDLDPNQDAKAPQGAVVNAGKLELISAASELKSVWKMPALKGLSSREVLQVLEGHSFHIEMKGEGLVHSQNPEAGRGVREGETVSVGLSEE